MSVVKRYDAVHIRYEDSNIRYGEGCEVEMIAAYDYDRLAVEGERLKGQVKMLVNQHMPLTDKDCPDGWSRVIEAKEAITERDQLAADNKRLREALVNIAENSDDQGAIDHARAALSTTANGNDVSVPAGVTLERDFMGTLHIKVGDFDFIQIQYQYPYTDNSGTWKLAERIAALLNGGRDE